MKLNQLALIVGPFLALNPDSAQAAPVSTTDSTELSLQAEEGTSNLFASSRYADSFDTDAKKKKKKKKVTKKKTGGS